MLHIIKHIPFSERRGYALSPKAQNERQKKGARYK
jgi:hypothetical protein